MLYEEFIGGDKGDGLPGAFVEEAVRLVGGGLEVDGFGAEGLPFGMVNVPAFLPGVLIAEEGDGGRQIGLQMTQDVDLGILVVIGGEGGIEPQIGDDAGVDVLRVGWVGVRGVRGSR